MRPIHVLVFVLPLVVLYEIGAFLYLRPSSTGLGAEQTIKAHRMVGDFFHSFGVAGIYLPAIVTVTVLLAWQVLSNERWKVKPWVLASMALESIVWTLPLLVLSAMHTRAMGGGGVSTAMQVVAPDGSPLALGVPHLAALAAQAVGGGGSAAGVGGGGGGGVGDWLELSWQARGTIAIGAGLYEELLFRFIGVAVLHFLVRDIGKMKENVAATIAVVGAAIAFALYHHTRLASGDMDWPRTLFLVAAGLYFGMLYILRGFGIVVGTHAVYDILVLVMLT